MHRVAAALALLSGVCAPLAADPDLERQAQLLHLLKHDCGSCHGMTLKGGLGPALTPGAMAGKPKDAMVETILHGRPGTPMPPWSTMLSRGETRWLVERLYRGETDAP